MRLRGNNMKIIDISQKIHSEMTVYSGDPHFHSHPCSSFKQGDMCEVSELTIGSHCGTHADAPLHMIPGGAPLESMPLDCYIGPCRVLTFKTDIITEKMLAEHQILEGERILLRTDSAGAYASRPGRFNPAVLSLRAAEYLAQQRVKLVGIDSPTVENMETGDGAVHRALLNAGIAILEGLCLAQATEERYFLSALPLSLPGENGSPCRAVLVKDMEC